ncbi:TetR/AcrR family transcriptional regulator [Halorubrum sp. Atlit-28R]|jgi:AcrR family transcriptional regulator|uniref:TetR/AcrR family transcriptional regulator n=1 Tax=Halorubrum sp. Atlit-28R TaxID=2282129 RepID=UPI000EF18F42|nr:TetR/AcrR family transcriptional regulator [Halorubrum sp. Atlit-28R]RLM49888.1 TetR/AcrR family transcriptional regulator [Halorubrum sp. Atlit-28R]
MPRFTDERREEIRESLLRAGRELFEKQGLEGTSIEELTNGADIATGTFYSFFESKEELLARILQHEAEAIYAELQETLRHHEDDPATGLREFLDIASDSLVSNPLFRGTIARDERERLRDELDEDTLHSTRLDKLSVLIPQLKDWQRRGLIIQEDAEIIALTLIYVSYLPLHRDEFRKNQYTMVREFLFDLAVSSIVTE